MLVTPSLIFRHFQPPSTEQIALFLGKCGPLLNHTASLADCVVPARLALVTAHLRASENGKPP